MGGPPVTITTTPAKMAVINLKVHRLSLFVPLTSKYLHINMFEGRFGIHPPLTVFNPFCFAYT